MSSINIVHLSDLHVRAKDETHTHMFRTLCRKLRNFRDEFGVNFDLLILSGDLVHQGSASYDIVRR